MAENQKADETLQGAVAFIGLCVILPLCYFEKIEFAWTGIICSNPPMISGILTHFKPQIEQKKAENNKK